LAEKLSQLLRRRSGAELPSLRALSDEQASTRRGEGKWSAKETSFWAQYNRLLAELVEDYVLHMQHHIDLLLRRQVITAYPAAASACQP
jgi:hypothetical protein